MGLAYLDRVRAARATADVLNARIGGWTAQDLLAEAILRRFPGRIAVGSSFGAESAVLLALVAEIDPATPVVFIDTGKLFEETLAYRDLLQERLGLTDLRIIAPDPAELAAEDPDGSLWQRDPDACCALRKVRPLETALGGFDAWINGRKRFQGASRAVIPAFEADEVWVKINPLASWSPEDIEREFARRALPAHPLAALGYLSIGCKPCTRPVAPGEASRAGRWSGTGKTECGIHVRPLKVSA